MAEIAVTKISSKGQIVIPSELREDFNVGEKFIIIKRKNQLILKRAQDLDKNFEEDLKFALRTEKALKRYEKGSFKKASDDEFLKMLEKW